MSLARYYKGMSDEYFPNLFTISHYVNHLSDLWTPREEIKWLYHDWLNEVSI